MSYDSAQLAVCANAIVDVGRTLAQRGWTPATSSNFSMRLDADHIAITISGRDKGKLRSADIMVIDKDGHALGTPAQPSAETALHLQIYQLFADAGAVLHTHSHNQTVASRLFARAGHIRLEGYELLKAVASHTTHTACIDLPVFPNTQTMSELTACVGDWLKTHKPLYGYLIDGHGIYTWGRDMAETERHLEAFEFLLGCELDLRRLRA